MLVAGIAFTARWVLSTLVGCFEGGQPIRQDQCAGRKDDTGKVVDGDDVVFDDNRNDVDRLKKQ